MVAMLVGVSLLVGSSSTPASATTSSWWNGSWAHRLNVQIVTSDALPAGYSLSFTLDHQSLVSNGKSLASGNDVRVAYWNGSAWSELDRVLAIGSSWNSTTTTLYFRTATAIGASTTSTDYYLYFGNPGAGSPPADANNVYDLFDDFADGTIDSGKWTIDQPSGLSVAETGGEIKVSGTTNGTNMSSSIGITTASQFSAGFVAESSFSIVSQSSFADTEWKSRFGLVASEMQIHATSNPDNAEVMYLSGTWTEVPGQNTTAFDVVPFGFQRVWNRLSPTGVGTFWENGSQVASRSGISTASRNLRFGYSPDISGATFDVRYDDIVVRKFVTNGPTLTLVTNNTTDVSVTIDPSFTFTIGNRSSSCNGESNFATAAGSATAVALGHLAAGTNVSGGQALTVASNAGYGFTVYIRGPYSSGNLRSGSHNWTDVAGSYASPAVLGSGERFGYTYADSTSSSSVTNPSSGYFAALDSTNRAVMGSATYNGGTGCVSFDAQASATTPAAAYTATVVYTAVPTF